MAPSGICYELSASRATWRILGNLAGLLKLLAYVGLLRLVPLHVRNPMTAGLAIAPKRSDASAGGRRASTWRLGPRPRAHPARLAVGHHTDRGRHLLGGAADLIL